MNPSEMEDLNLAGLLRLLQQECRSAADAQVNYRELLRYTVQIAAEREVAAGVLAELRELLEEYAPAWYAEEQHERVESVLGLLQRL